MAITKFLLPALSVASTAYAACSAGSTTTLSNPSDIASCSTFSGSIAVATGIAGSGTVDFGNIQKIDGDFSYEGDATVQTIMLGSLEEVTGDFTYSNLSALSATGLDKLKTVGGDVTLIGLGSLGDLGLTAGLQEAGTVTIVNTNIQDFQGIANISKIDGLAVSNNLNLGQISLDVDSAGMINIGPNQQSNGGQSTSFRNLISADTIVIRNSSDIDLSSLGNVTNDLRLIGNTVDSFAATNLTKVGALVINNNGALKNISFPALTQISSGNATLQIANNTKLNTIGGFPKLTRVNGDVTFSGNFSKLDFTGIKRIEGALYVDTASSSFDCSSVNNLADSHVVRGKDTCKIGDKSKVNGDTTGTGSSSDAAASSSNPASPMEIPADFMTGFTVLAGLLSVFM
ncbi:MAG: hypothetical protein MMC23_005151 [Stictis urceolatum]|nr:hypothetical protein [Stictis urceolata]